MGWEVWAMRKKRLWSKVKNQETALGSFLKEWSLRVARGKWIRQNIRCLVKFEFKMDNEYFFFHGTYIEKLVVVKAMAPTPVLLPGKSHGRRSLEGCSPWGCWGSDTTEWLHFHFSLSCIGKGNGNPLQCSCLENPRDRGAWWAAIYGVAQSRTQLKWLSKWVRCLEYNRLWSCGATYQ